jgi:P4 family phage/plasmid primase-like protien
MSHFAPLESLPVGQSESKIFFLEGHHMQNQQNENPYDAIQQEMSKLQEMELPVIPLRSHSKIPIINWKDHKVTTNEDVETWKKKYPTANIGLPLGSVSGFAAIDIDGGAGERLFEEMSQGDTPATWEAITGGGGRRIFYRIPNGMVLKKFAVVDRSEEHAECALLGEGQQTVMPPSIHPNGALYRWVEGHSPDDIECADAPSWMTERMTRRTHVAPSKVTNTRLDYGTVAQSGGGEKILDKLAAKCATFEQNWRDQRNGGVDEETWFTTSSLLVHSGHTEAAKYFSIVSEKYDARSEQRLNLLVEEAAKQPTGMTRCTKFGCSVERIRQCFNKERMNADGEIINSPGAFLKGRSEVAMLDQAEETVDEVIKQVKEGDMGAYLERESLRAFALLETHRPAEYVRALRKLEDFKGFKLKLLENSLRQEKKAMEQESQRETMAKVQDLAEIGLQFNAKTGQFTGVNGNVYARHILQSFSYMMTEGQRFHKYEEGVWNAMDSMAIQREQYAFFQKHLADEWNSMIENSYMTVLKRVTDHVPKTDQDKRYLNLSNGMLDLEAYKLEAHDQKFYSTIRIPIKYTPIAKCPKFRKFLRDVFEGDEERIRQAQEIMGYVLTADTKAQKAFILYGFGSNGKSVFAEILKALVGEQNTSSVTLKDLNNPFSRYDLVGKTLNIATENEIDEKGLNTESFKGIVTGDSIYVDIKHEQGFNYAPFCKLVFALNTLPYSRDRSHGFYRRLLILPFTRQFSEMEANRHLKDELLEELDGILLFALEGMQRLRQQNYVFSESVAAKAALEDYRQDVNPLYAFFEDRIQVTPEMGRVGKVELREEFNAWCYRNGHKRMAEMSARAFWKDFKRLLTEEGVQFDDRVKSNGVDYIVGITLDKPSRLSVASQASNDIADLFAEDEAGLTEDEMLEIPDWLQAEMEKESELEDAAMEYHFFAQQSLNPGLTWEEWEKIWVESYMDYPPVRMSDHNGFVVVNAA